MEHRKVCILAIVFAMVSCRTAAARSLQHKAHVPSSANRILAMVSNISEMQRRFPDVHLHMKLVADPLYCPIQLTAASKTKERNAKDEHENSKDEITKQLVLTAKQSSLDKMPKHIQMNVKRNLDVDPELRLRWLGDCDCLEYLKEHYDDELAHFYALEVIGLFRGDICRAAVLAREGGFYIDLDVQMREPLTSVVGKDTTVMFGIVGKGLMYNAIMAARPGSKIMSGAVEQIRQFYRTNGVGHTVAYLGCAALAATIENVRVQDCAGNHDLSEATSQWTCGKEVVRTFHERMYSCWPPEPGRPKSDCPERRALSMWAFEGAGYGLFTALPEDKLIGWSRMEECLDNGCEAGGYDQSTDLFDDAPHPA